MLDLEFIVSKSQESILEEYSYAGGILTVLLDLTEIDMMVRLMIRTDDLSFNTFYLEKKEELYRTCRVEIQELTNVLLTERAIYVPSETFGKLMNESRSNYNLAYGKKASEVKYIFSLVGYDKLLSCLLSNLSCISIAEID